MRALLTTAIIVLITGFQAHASQMVITVDDLPGAPRNFAAIRDTLTAHGLKGVFGFVNGAHGRGDPASQAAMGEWLAADHRLGNHTYSHGSLSEMGLDKFLEDIARNEPLLETLTGDNTSWRRFRYPFLVEGTTSSNRGAIAGYLQQHGYDVAQVTVDFYDWAFDDAYNRCAEMNDDEERRALRERYLQQAAAHLTWGDAAAEALFGHAIPHILLVHARTMTADMVDALITQYEEMGVEFVSLDTALANPAYKTSARRALNGTFLRQLVRAAPGNVHAPFPDHPTAWMDGLCR